MAQNKISELTDLVAGVFSDTDLFELSVDAGGGTFVTRKITGAKMKATIPTSSNLFDADDTLVANRTHDLNALKFGFTGGQMYNRGVGGISTCTAFGEGALKSNSTSANCTAFGVNSLTTLTGGNNNSAFGHESLNLVSTGSENTAVGNGAGRSINTGTSNTALGHEALVAATTVANNTAIGKSALISCTGGSNTSLGVSSGISCSTGTNNIFVGVLSGTGINTGTHNIEIAQTNATGTGITSGVRNTIIGSITGLGNVSNNAILSDGNGNRAVSKDANGNVSVGNLAALATTATNGFLHVPSCAGVPTGVPTAITGKIPIVVDSTNNKMYIYSGGSWVALN